MNKEKILHLSLEELIELKTEVEKAIKHKQHETRKNLMQEFKERAAQLGLTLEEVVGIETNKASRKTKGQKVEPKYRHPQNHDLTWTGRGRKPLWIENFLNDGGRLEQLAI